MLKKYAGWPTVLEFLDLQYWLNLMLIFQSTYQIVRDKMFCLSLSLLIEKKNEVKGKV